jgi:hypothetical protein
MRHTGPNAFLIILKNFLCGNRIFSSFGCSSIEAKQGIQLAPFVLNMYTPHSACNSSLCKYFNTSIHMKTFLYINRYTNNRALSVTMFLLTYEGVKYMGTDTERLTTELFNQTVLTSEIMLCQMCWEDDRRHLKRIFRQM